MVAGKEKRTGALGGGEQKGNRRGEASGKKEVWVSGKGFLSLVTETGRCRTKTDQGRGGELKGLLRSPWC